MNTIPENAPVELAIKKIADLRVVEDVKIKAGSRMFRMCGLCCTVEELKKMVDESATSNEKEPTEKEATVAAIDAIAAIAIDVISDSINAADPVAKPAAVSQTESTSPSQTSPSQSPPSQ